MKIIIYVCVSIYPSLYVYLIGKIHLSLYLCYNDIFKIGVKYFFEFIKMYFECIKNYTGPNFRFANY